MEPQTNSDEPRGVVPEVTSTDSVESTLRGFAYNILTGAFAVLPLLFLPVAYAPFDYTKTLFIIMAVLIGVIFFSLSVLRSGRITVPLPWALVALWGVAGATLLSALLSGDIYDSLIGDAVSVHSVVFIALLAVVASTLGIFGQNRSFTMRTYIALAASAGVVGLFQLLRVIIGAEPLSFGVLTGPTSSLLGSWNDLALFFGLIILLSLVALEQLPLTKWGQWLFMGVVGVSLTMLAVVNFFAVWMVLALVSLLMLMYSLTKDRFMSSAASVISKVNISAASVIVSAAVFTVSLIFVIGGSVVGTMVSNVTGISYVEVRPSLIATLDVARQTYQENAFVGVGANRFVDAWRLYKDQSLNQTIFWSTDFVSGSGYVSTQFVTTGIIGGIAWIAFLVLFIIYGLRTLFASAFVDKSWYFIATSAFVSAAYLWTMATVYTPSATILLFAAFFTGVTFAAGAALQKRRVYTFSIAQNKRAGFALVAVVMLIIVGAASSLYYIGRHYAAVYMYNGAVTGLDGSLSIEDIELKIADAFAMVQSDQFARQIALYQVAKMNALLALQEPTTEQQQAFQQAAANGVSAGQQAVALDGSDPLNHAVLGNVYSILAAAGVADAANRAKEAYASARALDPVNPSYALLEAQLLARTGVPADARTKIAEAVALKPNYTEALLLSTQIDVAEGKVADAIATTRSIISLEPNNAARYYQLGILLSADEKLDEAIAAFERAVALNPDYANARYFLALGYIEKGNLPAAAEQLEVVATLNPDNTEIKTLLEDVKAGRTPTPAATTETTPVADAEPEVTNDDGTVTTSEAPDTSLIVPVNPVSESSDNTTNE